MKNILRAIILLSVLGCNTNNDCSYKQPVSTNDGLSVSTLEKHNFDQNSFDRVNNDICSGKYGNIHSLLHLNKGKWHNKQVVPGQWIDEIFNPYIEIKHPLYSCCQWQMVKTEFGFNSWFIPGNGGQIINVVPELNMVIVINAENRRIPKQKRVPLEYLIKDLSKLHPEFKTALR